MTETTISSASATVNSGGSWISRYWLQSFLVIYGLWIWLPWLAPVFMRAGLDVPGHALYFI